jgi:hypothetical protein
MAAVKDDGVPVDVPAPTPAPAGAAPPASAGKTKTKVTRRTRLAAVTAEAAAVGIDLPDVIQRLFILRGLQFTLCLLAAVLSLVPAVGTGARPAYSLAFVGAILTLFKTAILYYRPDAVFHKVFPTVLDLFSAASLISSGATGIAYLRSLGYGIPAVTASVVLAFIAGALFIASAARIRRVRIALRNAARHPAPSGASPATAAAAATTTGMSGAPVAAAPVVP